MGGSGEKKKGAGWGLGGVRGPLHRRPSHARLPLGRATQPLQALTLFTSSAFLAAAVATLLAGALSQAAGRRVSMAVAGCLFVVGVGMTAGAGATWMLIAGRVLLGLGIGFANQGGGGGGGGGWGGLERGPPARPSHRPPTRTPAVRRPAPRTRPTPAPPQSVPVYLSETAPTNWRGAVSVMFQLATTFRQGSEVLCLGFHADRCPCSIRRRHACHHAPSWPTTHAHHSPPLPLFCSIFAAQMVNFLTAHVQGGWRISVGIAGAPALVLALGAAALPDTPNSLAERGKEGACRAALQRLRGADADVGQEHAALLAASAADRRAKPGLGAQWRHAFSRRYRPELVVACAVAFFSQMNG